MDCISCQGTDARVCVCLATQFLNMEVAGGSAMMVRGIWQEVLSLSIADSVKLLNN